MAAEAAEPAEKDITSNAATTAAAQIPVEKEVNKQGDRSEKETIHTADGDTRMHACLQTQRRDTNTKTYNNKKGDSRRQIQTATATRRETLRDCLPPVNHCL